MSYHISEVLSEIEDAEPLGLLHCVVDHTQLILVHEGDPSRDPRIYIIEDALISNT